MTGVFPMAGGPTIAPHRMEVSLHDQSRRFGWMRHCSEMTAEQETVEQSMTLLVATPMRSAVSLMNGQSAGGASSSVTMAGALPKSTKQSTGAGHDCVCGSADG